MYFIHVYIYFLKRYKKKKKIQNKISRFPNLSQKREIFSKKKKKGLWTRGIEPLSHLKKKKILWTRSIGLPGDFFKKDPFFSFKDFKNPLNKTFSKS